jgi:hypothetical protein
VPNPPSHARYVLMICYDFPGVDAAGVIRTYQIAKRLPDFGWQPVILTAQPCLTEHEYDIEKSDGALPCPKITVVPPRCLVPFQVDHHPRRTPLDAPGPTRSGLLKHLSRLVSQLSVPDGKIGWVFPAVRRGLQIAGDYPLAMCFSVSPRPTSHLVAYRLARRLNIPWVADFALPWSNAYWLSARPRVIAWLDRQLEGLVIGAAARVTVAYADLACSMSAGYRQAWADKLAVIPTGYEDDLFPCRSPSPAPKFTVVYPGNHFCEEGRNGEYFLKATEEWIDAEPGLKDEVELVFIGKRDNALLRHRATMAHPEVIRVEPLISHRAAIQAILSSHLCLVNTVGNRIPSKVYECMRAGKRILVLTDPGSDLATLVRHYPKAVVVPPKNTLAIRQALQNMWQSGRAGTLEPITIDPTVSWYSAKHGAELLAHIFERLIHCHDS